MSMFRKPLAALAVLALAVAITRADEPQQDEVACPIYSPKELVGTYRVTAAEKHGIRSPKLLIRGMIVRFTENTVVATDRNKNVIHSCTYLLEPEEGPMRILMVSNHESSKGAVVNGLVAREGERVRLIYSIPRGTKGEDGTDEAPTEFHTKKGQIMVLMEHVDDEPVIVMDKGAESK